MKQTRTLECLSQNRQERSVRTGSLIITILLVPPFLDKAALNTIRCLKQMFCTMNKTWTPWCFNNVQYLNVSVCVAPGMNQYLSSGRAFSFCFARISRTRGESDDVYIVAPVLWDTCGPDAPSSVRARDELGSLLRRHLISFGVLLGGLLLRARKHPSTTFFGDLIVIIIFT